MNKVWMLFYQENEYNQPPKAFEAILWEQPTAENIENALGISSHESISLKTQYQNIAKGKHVKMWGTEYWIEEFTKP